MSDLVGKSYIFEDGAVLKVIQEKRRDDGPWITYETSNGRSIPRKLVMPREEFIKSYGHLFGLTDPPTHPR